MQNQLETKSLFMAIVVTILISIGGLVEIVPLYLTKSAAPPLAGVKPYTPLELEGRDIYIREGCYLCHSQMVRPFRDETERYGPYSKAGEFVYDHPFQWGSKRSGPDLHRVGGKYLDSWHYLHMMDPRSTSTGSLMPPYPWLYTTALDTRFTQRKMWALKAVGVPYPNIDITTAGSSLQQQSTAIAGGLQLAGMEGVAADREIIAVIAYLQRLGTDIGWRQAAAQAR